MKYAIYAVGDALVDLEFEVTEAVLERLKIIKGQTALIDSNQLQQLLMDLKVPHKLKASGGSISNTIITAQLLGCKNFYCGLVANDENGEFIYQDFILKGIDNNLELTNRQTGLTGICIVLLTADGERSFCTFKGICESLSKQDIHAEIISRSNFVYTEGFLMTCESTFAAAEEAHAIAKKVGAKRVTALSDPYIVMRFKDNFLKLMSDRVDLLFCNEKEASLFCNSADLSKIQKTLMRYAKTFAITMDARGSIVFDGKEFHHCPAAPVQARDTLGAGDTFAGAFLYALNQGFSYKAANQLANLTAGQIVTKLGPRIDENDAPKILYDWYNFAK